MSWFKRPPWYRIEGQVRSPVWHILESQKTLRQIGVTPHTITTALCGYYVNETSSITANGVSNLSMRADVKTVKLRCKKCVKKQEKRMA